MQQYILKRVILYGVAIFIPIFVFATDWYIMTVDTTYYNGVYGTSIALDSLDIPHIAYCRYCGPGLMYASLNPDDSTWIIESVFDSTGVKCDIKDSRIAGTQPSLVFDSKGYPHISFWWGDLGYAWKDSLGWHTTHPNPGPWMRGTSLVLDTNDYPHIGYSVDISNEEALVLYTYQDEYGWHTEIVDTIFVSWIGNVSLASDKDNNIHIAYGRLRREQYFYGLPDIGIGYGIRDGAGEWGIDTIIDSADTVIEWEHFPSLVLDSLGCPCISYQGGAMIDTNISRLKYAVKIDNEWQIEWVEVGKAVGAYNFLALDACNNPHISYYGDAWLKYALKRNGIWYTERIDSAWGRITETTYTGIAVDRNGYAHISYNTQLGDGTNFLINTRYATGLSEAGIEIEMDRHYGNLLMVCPSVSISQIEVEIEYVPEKEYNVSVCIYNIIGQKVTELVNERKQLGKYKDHWKTESVGSGIYFCCLVLDGKLIVVRKIEIFK